MRASSWAVRFAAAIATSLLTITVAAAGAQAAAAATHPPVLWVSASAPTVPGTGKSCTQPGFSTVQAAVSAAPAGAVVKVCAGTYAEQVEITKSLTLTGTGGTVTLALPASPADSAACASGPHPQYGVDVCGPVQVSLANLTVDSAWAAGTCNDDLNAVYVAGGAAVAFLNSAVTAAGASPINGCQGGIGILVTDGHLVAMHSSVSGYQKNGITVKGTTSTAVISHVTVTGAGPATAIAQNGIEIADGAAGAVSASTVSGNECDHSSCGPDSQNQYQATGVLFYNAAAGSVLSHSSVSGNDIGVYFAGPAGKQPGVVVTRDLIRGNRYEDVCLDQGHAVIDHSVLSGGNVALQAIQYNGQTAGIDAAAAHDVIGPATVHAVQVYSDQAGGDLPGKLVITHSPVKGSIANNSPAAAPVTVIVH